MLATVQLVKEQALAIKKVDDDQIEQELKRMRRSIVKGCGELMELGEWFGSLRCDLTIFSANRTDLQERCRTRLAKELAESEFRNTGVRLSDGSDFDGVPCLIIKLNWAHFSENTKPKSGNVIQECAICITEKPMCALTPCGHICCSDCNQKAQCPFCRTQVASCVPLFNSAPEPSAAKRRRME